MLLDFIGKLLFPRRAPWDQRRELNHLMAAISVALLMGGVVVLLMFFVNAKR